MKPREEAAMRVVAWLHEHPEFNAPYGVLEGKSADSRSYNVTFGRARYLDAEVRVYSPQWVMLRHSRDPARQSQVFKGATAVDDLLTYIKQEL